MQKGNLTSIFSTTHHSTEAMKVCAFQLNPHLHFLKPSHSTPKTPKKLLKNPSLKTTTPPISIKTTKSKPLNTTKHEIPRWVVLGGASLGIALLVNLGVDGQHEALALGPEGPLVEEFWDNMRRYGLYVLTVSTGVIYTIFQPIVELLKNPITAILIITVVVGSAYLVSQVLSAMVGISEFAYDYGY